MTPNFTQSDASLKAEQATEIVELFDEIDTKSQEQPKEVVVPLNEPNPLEIIQKDLEIMVMGDEAGELAISTCV